MNCTEPNLQRTEPDDLIVRDAGSTVTVPAPARVRPFSEMGAGERQREPARFQQPVALIGPTCTSLVPVQAVERDCAVEACRRRTLRQSARRPQALRDPAMTHAPFRGSLLECRGGGFASQPRRGTDLLVSDTHPAR
jgi:hypothetical protein